MNIQKNKDYIIRFSIDGRLLTYHCHVTDIDEAFISFTDIYDKKLTFRVSYIVSFEEEKTKEESFYQP